MLSLYGGMERTPEQFARIAERAGLSIKSIWECRGPVSIVEMCAVTASGMRAICRRCVASNQTVYVACESDD